MQVKNKPNINPLQVRFVIVAAAVIAALVLVTNLFVKDPPAGDFDARIKAAQAADDDRELVAIYEQMLAGDRHKIDYHFHYVNAVGELPRQHDDENDMKGHPDPKVDEVKKKYLDWTKSADPAERDIAFYCLGLMASLDKQFDEALRNYEKVRNRSLKYLNNSSGYATLRRETGKPSTDPACEAKAASFFGREIEQGGNLAGATHNLTELHLKHRRFAEVGKIAGDPRLREFVGGQARRLVSIDNGEWAAYARALLCAGIIDHFNLIAFVGALAGALAWYHYFRRIDIFEPEKHRYLLLTLFGGALCGPVAVGCYDAMDYFGYFMPGTWWGDFIYCVCGIGFVEELAKLIPFLLVISLTRECNESIDYIIYASMAALGFATAENVMYIDNYGSHIVLARSTISATLHMFDVSIVAYGIILARYRKWGGYWRNIVLFFMLAALAHGVFDYPLVSEALPVEARMVVLPIVVLFFAWFGLMISNALGQSCFYDEKRGAELSRLGVHLAYGLLGVACIEFVLLSIQSGPVLAQRAGARGMIVFVPALYFLCVGLARIKTGKGHWRGLDGICELPAENGGERVILSREPTAEARAEQLDPTADGTVLNRKTFYKMAWPMIVMFVVLFLFPVAMACGYACDSVDRLMACLGIYFCVFFIAMTVVAKVSERMIKMSVARRVAEKVIAGRPGRIVHPGDPDALFVEFVSRENWLKGGERAVDVGFLAISPESELLFEGGRERWIIPAESIASISIAPNRPVRNPKRVYCVLKCRFAGGDRELPLRIRINDGIFDNPQKREPEDHLANHLVGAMLELFPGDAGLFGTAKKVMGAMKQEFYGE
ncbi:MAG: PrsW family intramembrane metalloprotease [Candidatus Sumerlaeia bacterium]